MDNKTTIKIYAISTTTDQGTTGSGIITTQKICMDDINNDPNILSNYHLQLKLLECDGVPTAALKHSVNIITENIENNNNNENTIISPIILGCPWSSFSVRTAPVLGAYNFGQIASSATSTALSNTKLYPFFYRTIPSDALQGKAFIELAKKFGWTKLGVVYFDDNYGINLNKVIVDEASKYDIKIYSIHYTLDDPNTFSLVSQFVKQNKLYITVLIVKTKDLPPLFTEFEKIEILGYPWFYMGTDAWFDHVNIKKYNLTSKTQGFMGTIPSFPALLTEQQYIKFNTYDNNGNTTIFQQSINIQKHIRNLYASYHSTSALSAETPDFFAYFGYDSATTLANVLHKFDTEYGLKNYLLNGSIDLSVIMNKLNTYIINSSEPHFIGATGPIHFDQNGDRLSGFFAFGRFEGEDTKIFGVIDENGTAIFDDDNIIWSKDFDFHGQPLSHPQIQYNRMQIQSQSFYVVALFCMLSIIITIISGITVWYGSIRKKSKCSIQFLLVCSGCILAYIGIFLYGTQNFYTEYYDKNEYILLYTIGCNVNIWIINIVFTLSFVPMFAGAYSFNYAIKMLIKNDKILSNKTKLTDSDLLHRICVAFGIDIALLTLFAVTQIISYFFFNVMILSFEFSNSGEPVTTTDPLLLIQYEYSGCIVNNNIGIGFYCLLLLYKCIQIFVSLSAYQARIVVLFGFILLIAVTSFAISTVDYSSFNGYYIIESSILIIFMNAVLIINVWSKMVELCAVKRNMNQGKEDELKQKDSRNDNQRKEIPKETNRIICVRCICCLKCMWCCIEKDKGIKNIDRSENTNENTTQTTITSPTAQHTHLNSSYYDHEMKVCDDNKAEINSVPS
eukprot:243480_1